MGVECVTASVVKTDDSTQWTARGSREEQYVRCVGYGKLFTHQYIHWPLRQLARDPRARIQVDNPSTQKIQVTDWVPLFSRHDVNNRRFRIVHSSFGSDYPMSSWFNVVVVSIVVVCRCGRLDDVVEGCDECKRR